MLDKSRLGIAFFFLLFSTKQQPQQTTNTTQQQQHDGDEYNHNHNHNTERDQVLGELLRRFDEWWPDDASVSAVRRHQDQTTNDRIGKVCCGFGMISSRHQPSIRIFICRGIWKNLKLVIEKSEGRPISTNFTPNSCVMANQSVVRLISERSLAWYRTSTLSSSSRRWIVFLGD